MKVSLVVAQGVHTGKVIPVAGTQFLIGRDPHCNLRPASPSISKQHCGIFVRGEAVVVVDYGSTNGTQVNGTPVTGEHELRNGDKLKAGPLEFEVRLEATSPGSTISAPPKKVAPKPAAAPATVAVAPTPKPVAPAPAPKPVAAAAAVTDDDPDAAAAMLLAMDDGDTPTTEAVVPDGATVMDIPAMGDDPAGKKPAAAAKPAPVDSSKAAADILSKYMRRPRS